MTITLARLVGPKYIETSTTSQYIAASKTIVDSAVITNVGGSDITFSVYLVPNGDLPSNENKVVSAVLLKPSESYSLSEITLQVLDSGDSLAAISSELESALLVISGRIV